MLIRVAIRYMPTAHDKDATLDVTIPLPSYVMVGDPHPDGWALVDVPDTDIPDLPALKAILTAPPNNTDPRRKKPSKALVETWHAHLDNRYREHAGTWRLRPEPA